MGAAPTPGMPSPAATPRRNAMPAIAAAIGFGVGVNAAVASVVASVLAVSSADALDSLTSASLRPASDTGLGIAIALSLGLVSMLAAFAGDCLARGQRPQAGAACRMALPGAAGAAAGLFAGAWLLSRFLGSAEAGTPHALGLAGWWPAAIVVFSLVAGAGWRSAAATAVAVASGVAAALRYGASPRMRTAAVAGLSVTLLALGGLALSRGHSADAAGNSRSLARPGGCPGRTLTQPPGGCAQATGACKEAAERRGETPAS